MWSRPRMMPTVMPIAMSKAAPRPMLCHLFLPGYSLVLLLFRCGSCIILAHIGAIVWPEGEFPGDERGQCHRTR
jgi:hypothetical protein